MKLLNAVLILVLAFIFAKPYIGLPYNYLIPKLDGYKIEKATDKAPWGNEKVNYICIFNKDSEPLAVIIRSLKNTTLLVLIKRGKNHYLLWEKERRNVRIQTRAKAKSVVYERNDRQLYWLPIRG